MAQTPRRGALKVLNHNTSSPFPHKMAHPKLNPRYNPYPSPSPSSSHSSPAKLYRTVSLDLNLQEGDVVYVGRKAPSSAKLKQSGCNRYHLLSGRARVSRFHAIVRPGSITVTGQNGIKVNDQTIDAGDTYYFSKDSAVLYVDFHDAVLAIRPPASHNKTLAKDWESTDPLSMPPTDEVVLSTEEPDEAESSSDVSSEEEGNDKEAEDANDEEDLELPESPKKEVPSAAPLSVPSDVDLPGLIASALVFNTRTTMSTSEIMRALIPSLPSLNLSTTLRALENGPFEHSSTSADLKDAAGRPVEPQWWYEPRSDQDTQRRESLLPFVKSVRQSKRSNKQYFYKPIR